VCFPYWGPRQGGVGLGAPLHCPQRSISELHPWTDVLGTEALAHAPPAPMAPMPTERRSPAASPDRASCCVERVSGGTFSGGLKQNGALRSLGFVVFCIGREPMRSIAYALALALGVAFAASAFAADVTTAKTKADCDKAGGVWDATTNTCMAKQ
jgi:hypothetical protein